MKTGLVFYQGDWVAGGLWRYGYSLATEFLKLDASNEYKLIHGYKRPENFIGLERIEQLIPLNSWQKILRLPQILNKNNFDVIHVTENACPLFIRPKYKTLVNMHDLMPLALPQAVNKKTFLYYKYYLPQALKRVDSIITSSEYSKNDLIKFYGIDDKKIKIIYHGIPSHFFGDIDSGKLEYFKNKYKITHPFLLSVSGINFRKNLKIVFEAFNVLSKYIKQEYKILLVGKAESEADPTRQLIKKMNLENNVRFLGYVPEDDLLYFYKLASVFLFPSLYEGFGLPVIEAMAAGCPVISSNATCLPEITGGAALLLDPNKIGDWSEAMSSILTNSEIKNNLINKGKNHAQQFTWEKSAREHLKCYYD